MLDRFLDLSNDTCKSVTKRGAPLGRPRDVPAWEIQEAIKHGVRKINIDTDIRLAMTGAIRKYMAENPRQVRPARLPEARAARRARKSARERYLQFGCEGQGGEDLAVELARQESA